MNERRNSVLLWTIFVILVALLFVFGIGWAQDPCAACPDPEGFSCKMWPDMCYACWEQCGQPIATPTPTRTPTPTPTPIPPTPTPTPIPVGPPCTLLLTEDTHVYLVAIYAHEWPTRGLRYTYTTHQFLAPANHEVYPCPCEGYPVGFEWHDARTDEVILACGDTERRYPRIFSDGFEKGSTSEWSEVRAER